MVERTITRTLLSNLAPLPEGATKVRIFDDEVTGFIAEQRRSCVTFYLRYADARRRSHEIKLGRLGDVTVDQARRRAEQLRASVSLGADPAADVAKRRAVPTLAEFVRDRYLPHVRERLRSGSNIEGQLRLRILPALGRRPLDEVRQDDVAALRRRLVDEGLAAATVNRHLATVRAMFNLAQRRPRGRGGILAMFRTAARQVARRVQTAAARPMRLPRGMPLRLPR